MSKRCDSGSSDRGRFLPLRINTGLSDALAGISFTPLPSSSQWKREDAPAKTTPVPHRADVSRDRSKGLVSRRSEPCINKGLADALNRMQMGGSSGHDEPKVPPDISRQHSVREAAPHYSSPDESHHRLPSHLLRALGHLPEWENTRNFVFVKVQGQEYTYPIHSWLPVVDLCEAIYKGCAIRLIIREQSRKAIAEIVQGHCDRGPFNLIARSLIERAVRSRLASMFSTKRLEPRVSTRHQCQVRSVAQAVEVPQPLTYEERMRQYRVRNPHDARDSSVPVRNRLSEYIASKAKRVGDGSDRSLDGAFTSKPSSARTVWVGLDFGTRNLKIAFRDGETDDQSVVLELNPDAHGIDRFMIAPNTTLQDERLVHGNCVGGYSPSWKHALSAFYGESYSSDGREIRSWLTACADRCSLLRERTAEELVLFFTSVHLGFLLATAGRTVRAYYQGVGISDSLAFRIFMCAPVAALNQQLSESVFQDCLTIADEMHAILDLSKDSVSVRDALEAYDKASRLAILLEPRPCRRSRVVPEVLAEIASFAQSRSAQEGVYALVDIGAGTLDLNVFRVIGAVADKGIHTPIFAATCHPNGVSQLESLLVGAMDGRTQSPERHFEEQKQRRQFPDVDALAQALGVPGNRSVLQSLSDAHRAYCEDVAKRTRMTWIEAWDKRGLERQDWERLTMFVCGGGAGIRGIQERLKEGMPEQIIRRISYGVLPCPGDEEFVRPMGFPEEEFHRVAVAYGLTFGSDFEPYTLPNQIASVSVHRETDDVESRYISMDMV